MHATISRTHTQGKLELLRFFFKDADTPSTTKSYHAMVVFWSSNPLFQVLLVFDIVQPSSLGTVFPYVVKPSLCDFVRSQMLLPHDGEGQGHGMPVIHHSSSFCAMLLQSTLCPGHWCVEQLGFEPLVLSDASACLAALKAPCMIMCCSCVSV